MIRPTRPLSRILTIALLATLTVAVTYHLPDFPGLHGDEAWAGLRALDIQQKGLFTIHGMNVYTGALFPQIVAAVFSVLGADVLSLRLPGAILNCLAVVILVATFWRRGYSAFIVTLLFASSFLFLFSSRVAWEVCALQNFLLALIVAALSGLLKADRARLGATLLFFLAFALGTWNHFIFSAASLSLALAAAFLAIRSPDTDSARAFLLGAFNLPLQGLLIIGKPFISNGPFPSHALPALLVGLALVLLTSIAYVRLEARLLPLVIEFPVRRKDIADRVRTVLVYGIAAGLLVILPLDGASFFGTVSGYIMMERVVSYIPSLSEAVGLHLRMAILVVALGVFAFREIRRVGPFDKDPLRSLLVFWAVAFLPILLVEETGQSDRYFIIPQFLFFSALALSFDALSLRWKQTVLTVLALGFVYSQIFLWQEVTRVENRQPVDYRYVFHKDTSRHFLRLDRLEAYLQGRGICHTVSGTFFIEKPLQFLQAAKPPCRTTDTVRIEYCDTCRAPVEWFAVGPQAAR
jgi:hypothetical protein